MRISVPSRRSVSATSRPPRSVMSESRTSTSGRVACTSRSAAALSACLAPQPVTRPSETHAPTTTPTPIPTFTLLPETPTPTPTIATTPPPTTPPRTPKPAPTNHDAGDKLIPYYFVVRGQFSIFPPTPQLDFDFASDVDGDAFFRGLTPVGQPIFTVRE